MEAVDIRHPLIVTVVIAVAVVAEVVECPGALNIVVSEYGCCVICFASFDN